MKKIVLVKARRVRVRRHDIEARRARVRRHNIHLMECFQEIFRIIWPGRLFYDFTLSPSGLTSHSEKYYFDLFIKTITPYQKQLPPWLYIALLYDLYRLGLVLSDRFQSEFHSLPEAIQKTCGQPQLVAACEKLLSEQFLKSMDDAAAMHSKAVALLEKYGTQPGFLFSGYRLFKERIVEELRAKQSTESSLTFSNKKGLLLSAMVFLGRLSSVSALPLGRTTSSSFPTDDKQGDDALAMSQSNIVVDPQGQQEFNVPINNLQSGNAISNNTPVITEMSFPELMASLDTKNDIAIFTQYIQGKDYLPAMQWSQLFSKVPQSFQEIQITRALIQAIYIRYMYDMHDQSTTSWAELIAYQEKIKAEMQRRDLLGNLKGKFEGTDSQKTIKFLLLFACHDSLKLSLDSFKAILEIIGDKVLQQQLIGRFLRIPFEQEAETLVFRLLREWVESRKYILNDPEERSLYAMDLFIRAHYSALKESYDEIVNDERVTNFKPFEADLLYTASLSTTDDGALSRNLRTLAATVAIKAHKGDPFRYIYYDGFSSRLIPPLPAFANALLWGNADAGALAQAVLSQLQRGKTFADIDPVSLALLGIPSIYPLMMQMQLLKAPHPIPGKTLDAIQQSEAALTTLFSNGTSPIEKEILTLFYQTYFGYMRVWFLCSTTESRTPDYNFERALGDQFNFTITDHIDTTLASWKKEYGAIFAKIRPDTDHAHENRVVISHLYHLARDDLKKLLENMSEPRLPLPFFATPLNLSSSVREELLAESLRNYMREAMDTKHELDIGGSWLSGLQAENTFDFIRQFDLRVRFMATHYSSMLKGDADPKSYLSVQGRQAEQWLKIFHQPPTTFDEIKVAVALLQAFKIEIELKCKKEHQKNWQAIIEYQQQLVTLFAKHLGIDIYRHFYALRSRSPDYNRANAQIMLVLFLTAFETDLLTAKDILQQTTFEAHEDHIISTIVELNTWIAEANYALLRQQVTDFENRWPQLFQGGYLPDVEERMVKMAFYFITHQYETLFLLLKESYETSGSLIHLEQAYLHSIMIYEQDPIAIRYLELFYTVNAELWRKNKLDVALWRNKLPNRRSNFLPGQALLSLSPTLNVNDLSVFFRDYMRTAALRGNLENLAKAIVDYQTLPGNDPAIPAQFYPLLGLEAASEDYLSRFDYALSHIMAEDLVNDSEALDELKTLLDQWGQKIANYPFPRADKSYSDEWMDSVIEGWQMRAAYAIRIAHYNRLRSGTMVFPEESYQRFKAEYEAIVHKIARNVAPSDSVIITFKILVRSLYERQLEDFRNLTASDKIILFSRYRTSELPDDNTMASLDTRRARLEKYFLDNESYFLSRIFGVKKLAFVAARNIAGFIFLVWLLMRLSRLVRNFREKNRKAAAIKAAVQRFQTDSVEYPIKFNAQENCWKVTNAKWLAAALDTQSSNERFGAIELLSELLNTHPECGIQVTSFGFDLLERKNAAEALFDSLTTKLAVAENISQKAELLYHFSQELEKSVNSYIAEENRKKEAQTQQELAIKRAEREAAQSRLQGYCERLTTLFNTPYTSYIRLQFDFASGLITPTIESRKSYAETRLLELIAGYYAQEQKADTKALSLVCESNPQAADLFHVRWPQKLSEAEATEICGELTRFCQKKGQDNADDLVRINFQLSDEASVFVFKLSGDQSQIAEQRQLLPLALSLIYFKRIIVETNHDYETDVKEILAGILNNSDVLKDALNGWALNVSYTPVDNKIVIKVDNADDAALLGEVLNLLRNLLVGLGVDNDTVAVTATVTKGNIAITDFDILQLSIRLKRDSYNRSRSIFDTALKRWIKTRHSEAIARIVAEINVAVCSSLGINKPSKRKTFVTAVLGDDDTVKITVADYTSLYEKRDILYALLETFCQSGVTANVSVESEHPSFLIALADVLALAGEKNFSNFEKNLAAHLKQGKAAVQQMTSSLQALINEAFSENKYLLFIGYDSENKRLTIRIEGENAQEDILPSHIATVLKTNLESKLQSSRSSVQFKSLAEGEAGFAIEGISIFELKAALNKTPINPDEIRDNALKEAINQKLPATLNVSISSIQLVDNTIKILIRGKRKGEEIDQQNATRLASEFYRFFSAGTATSLARQGNQCHFTLPLENVGCLQNLAHIEFSKESSTDRSRSTLYAAGTPQARGASPTRGLSPTKRLDPTRRLSPAERRAMSPDRVVNSSQSITAMLPVKGYYELVMAHYDLLDSMQEIISKSPSFGAQQAETSNANKKIAKMQNAFLCALLRFFIDLQEIAKLMNFDGAIVSQIKTARNSVAHPPYGQGMRSNIIKFMTAFKTISTTPHVDDNKSNFVNFIERILTAWNQLEHSLPEQDVSQQLSDIMSEIREIDKQQELFSEAESSLFSLYLCVYNVVTLDELLDNSKEQEKSGRVSKKLQSQIAAARNWIAHDSETPLTPFFRPNEILPEAAISTHIAIDTTRIKSLLDKIRTKHRGPSVSSQPSMSPPVPVMFQAPPGDANQASSAAGPSETGNIPHFSRPS